LPRARDLVVEDGEALALLLVPVLAHLQQPLLGLLLPQPRQLLVLPQQLMAVAARMRGREKSKLVRRSGIFVRTHLLVFGVQIFLDLAPLLEVPPLTVELHVGSTPSPPSLYPRPTGKNHVTQVSVVER